MHTRSFVLQLAPGESAAGRIGITVSRQVGKAVRRNRVKRLVREAFRQNRALFPAATDVVVIAKTDCCAARLADVVAEFERASAAMHSARQRAPRPERGT